MPNFQVNQGLATSHLFMPGELEAMRLIKYVAGRVKKKGPPKTTIARRGIDQILSHPGVAETYLGAVERTKYYDFEPFSPRGVKQRGISTSYKLRAARVVQGNVVLQREIQELLLEGLQEATLSQLYLRTKLPVTGRMFASIGVRYIPLGAANGGSFEVGYNVGDVFEHIEYADHRLRMTGPAADGHLKDMNPEQYLKEFVYIRIGMATRAMKKRAIEGP